MDRNQKQSPSGHPQYRPRKVLLDSNVYSSHSMRQSDGDADCDHDFEIEPNVKQPTFAVWNCTICGRAIKFDVWN